MVYGVDEIDAKTQDQTTDLQDQTSQIAL